MNHLDLDDPLARLVGDALRLDAERAPVLAERWDEVDVGRRPFATATDRRPWLRVAGVAASAALLVGGFAWAVRSRDNGGLGGPATTWLPDGTEVPLTDLGTADSVVRAPVPAGVTRRIGLAGQPDIVLTPQLVYSGGATAELQSCVGSPDGAFACRSEGVSPSWTISGQTGRSNLVAASDLFQIDGLPEAVAFVTYQHGDQHLWQRPIAGVAAFPDASAFQGPSGDDAVVVGYDVTGRAIGRFDVATLKALPTVGGEPSPTVGLNAGQSDRMSTLTRERLTACLTGRGGVVGEGGVATFPDGVDQRAVWDTCVASTKAAVAAAVAELVPGAPPTTAP